MNNKSSVFKNAGLFFLSLIVVVFLIELLLRIGGFWISRQGSPEDSHSGNLIIFAGDSWTYGCDATENKGFYFLLTQDKELSKYALVNLGYGANNYFQIANSVIRYKPLPRIAIINGGINGWHMIGFEEFIENASAYLNDEEMQQLRSDFNVNPSWRWIKGLKIYKLYCYLAKQDPFVSRIDIKWMNKKIGSPVFWGNLMSFRKAHPNYNQQPETVTFFLKGAKNLSLDQKFYFTALHLGFNTDEMINALREAGEFFPEKLKIVPYDFYKKFEIEQARWAEMNELIIKWSLKVLGKWAKRNNVIVFVQTYPNITKIKQKNETLGGDINRYLRLHAKINALEVIDHNANNSAWESVETVWHVNDEGHKLMAKNIKKQLTERISSSSEFTRAS